MIAKSLRAHLDGDRIVLDEPFEIEPDSQIIVTILLKSDDMDSEREDWANLAMQSLERAYGDNEPEYTLDMVKEVNPKYERR